MQNCSISFKTQSSAQGQVSSYHPYRRPKSFGEMLLENGIVEPARSLVIVVHKSEHTLSLFWRNCRLKSYHVGLGDKGLTDKELSGDHKTPEGTFYIAEKVVLDPPDRFLGTRWMRLSYPNIEDAERGRKHGFIDSLTYETIVSAIKQKLIPPQQTVLGGGIGIHGGGGAATSKDWTWGCVGLSDCDIEDFYDYIAVGTSVIIER